MAVPLNHPAWHFISGWLVWCEGVVHCTWVLRSAEDIPYTDNRRSTSAFQRHHHPRHSDQNRMQSFRSCSNLAGQPQPSHVGNYWMQSSWFSYYWRHYLRYARSIHGPYVSSLRVYITQIQWIIRRCVVHRLWPSIWVISPQWLIHLR